MEELCIALSESYMEKNPNVTVTTEYIGSTAGIEKRCFPELLIFEHLPGI